MLFLDLRVITFQQLTEKNICYKMQALKISKNKIIIRKL